MRNATLHINRRLAAFIGALLLFALAASGCLFDTRDAEPPLVGGITVTFDQPQKVFTGMRVGLEDEKNFSNFERAIGDDYFFSPLPQDSLNPTFLGSPVFANWTRQVEIDAADLLQSEADTIEVEFTPAELVSQNTFVKYDTQYNLRVVRKANGQSTTYRGKAYIGVRRIGGVWQVVYWDEYEPDETADSWGFLRGTLRQRLQ